jgi:hypothetical protein
MFAIFRAQYRAAARREDDTVALRQFIDDARLALPESFLALKFPDDRNPRAGARLDLVVGIDERSLQTARNRTAHGGFSRPHESDKKDVRVRVPGLQLGSFKVNLNFVRAAA